MKADKEMFGADDWLSKEIQRESRISAWDLDEGKSLRREHEEDCDARQVAIEHERFHNATQRTIRSSKKEERPDSGRGPISLITVGAILMVLSPFSIFARVLTFGLFFGFLTYLIIKLAKSNSKGE
ncbi:MAG: hypothetical protein IJ091_03940 [Oscillospiraceae bacterium]|nr:hypothetical protein [Oscillospiraceae bacterium]